MYSVQVVVIACVNRKCKVGCILNDPSFRPLEVLIACLFLSFFKSENKNNALSVRSNLSSCIRLLHDLTLGKKKRKKEKERRANDLMTDWTVGVIVVNKVYFSFLNHHVGGDTE